MGEWRRVISTPPQRFIRSLLCGLIGGKGARCSKTKTAVFSGIGFPVKKTILLPFPKLQRRENACNNRFRCEVAFASAHRGRCHFGITLAYTLPD